ncbi:N-acetyltransferase [Burkholderia sp. Ac-20353]|uniref:GNAT family N-acetyltransferase n=1 Tax=Burkholderia sp. Ac-20353 TaxID=2703894 RepID=UPI00197BE4A1|nr:N-acetyltransferase [Burkholderia sp. Ac-20353]MBN3786205.1 GNAT family N-acetyltransferase [Burkholderia sp. Ac-20353]
MKASHSIRAATSADAARIAVLGAHVWIHTYATTGVSDIIAQYVLATFTPQRVLAMLNDPDIIVLVAEADASLVGYVVMRFGSLHADVATEIETLYVQQAFAGRGIGAALLDRAREIAAARTGSRAIWLLVNAQNRNAISFYHRQGLKQDGIAYFELGGTKHENNVLIARD